MKFGTGGFRGIIGDDFTKSNVQLVAQALSNMAAGGQKNKPVIVGYDNRFMSDYFAGWMAEVFAGNGIKTLLYTQPTPTPAVMCATRDMGNEYGVMITASHNPYVFNGVKIFLRTGIDADVEFTNQLEMEANKVKNVATFKQTEARKSGLIEDFSSTSEYLQNIKKFILPGIRKNNAHVLFDNMFGLGNVGLSILAVEFNLRKFTAINTAHDAFFNFELPNPVESALSHLKTKVISEGYDYAIATDSDADRLGVIDDQGNYVDSNKILGALYYYLVKYRGMKGDIVKNFSTSVLMDKLAEKLGFRCHEVDIGFKNISAKMKETDALIGGESSGGLTVRDYLFGKDSIFSASLFMEMQIMMKKPVSKIMEETAAFAGYDCVTGEDSVEFTRTDIIERLAGKRPFGGNYLDYQILNNNIKYRFSDGGWLLFRKSGTEPLLRITAEMRSAAELKGKLKTAKEFLHELEA